jgi:hypothetical protein
MDDQDKEQPSKGDCFTSSSMTGEKTNLIIIFSGLAQQHARWPVSQF